MGTDGAETLTGTSGNDAFTGKGGNDTLKGLAGNDVYYFVEGWGNDTVEEKASYKIGGKKLPGGIDTLSFAKVSGPVHAYLIRQWEYQNVAYRYANDGRVDLGRWWRTSLGAVATTRVTVAARRTRSSRAVVPWTG